MAESTFNYDVDYYSALQDGSRISAKLILPFVINICRARSILDVGCGPGSWLAAAQKCGITDIMGIDGPWIQAAELEIPACCFRSVLLGEKLKLERRFDLAMCLEVAEHLPADAAGTLIDALVLHAPIVLFSAAIPGQGGEGHVNEVTARDWRNLFDARGYQCFDPIRLTFWDNDEVDVWYRQNARLFVAKELLIADADLRSNLMAYQSTIDDVVHPKLFEQRCRQASDLQERNDELANWALGLQEKVRKYETFPPLAIALSLRRLTRRAPT